MRWKESKLGTHKVGEHVEVRCRFHVFDAIEVFHNNEWKHVPMNGAIAVMKGDLLVIKINSELL